MHELECSSHKVRYFNSTRVTQVTLYHAVTCKVCRRASVCWSSHTPGGPEHMGIQQGATLYQTHARTTDPTVCALTAFSPPGCADLEPVSVLGLDRYSVRSVTLPDAWSHLAHGGTGTTALSKAGTQTSAHADTLRRHLVVGKPLATGCRPHAMEVACRRTGQQVSIATQT